MYKEDDVKYRRVSKPSASTYIKSVIESNQIVYFIKKKYKKNSIPR